MAESVLAVPWPRESGAYLVWWVIYRRGRMEWARRVRVNDGQDAAAKIQRTFVELREDADHG